MSAQTKPIARNIYAYCNIQTQQVIYSLQPSLHNASVRRQLPDTGANTSFVKLRKDLWQPLWTLAIPESEHADAQGRHTFKKLREWRKLHEVSWEPPADLARPYTKREIEAMEKKLEDRGGSKKENVYDIIRREKKKMRINTVLNQRANSVADLAAVLVEQEAMGLDTAEQNDAGASLKLQAERGNMLKLAAEANNGGFKKLDDRIFELQELMAKADRLGEVGTSRTRIGKQLRDAKVQRMKMQTSVDAVAQAEKTLAQPHKDRVATLEARIKDAEARAQAYERLPDLARLADGSAEVEGSWAQLEVRAEELKQLLNTKKQRHTQERTAELAALRARQQEQAEARYTMKRVATIQGGALQRLQTEIESMEALGSRDVNANKLEIATMLRRENLRGDGFDSDSIEVLKRSASELVAVEQQYASLSNAGVELAEAKAELETLEAETATAEAERALSAEPKFDEAQIRELLPGFPAPKSDSPNLPKRGRLRTMIDRQKRPVFSTEGVKIKWSNLLDAEFAEEWPANVAHAPMGFVRHTAPHADKEAVLDVATARENRLQVEDEWKGRAKAVRERERRVELEVLEKVREAMEARKKPWNPPPPNMAEETVSL